MARVVLFLLFSLVLSGVSYGAQSTADVPFSTEMKNSVLKEIRGNNVATLPQEAEYVIGHGDILTVSIYEEGDMSALGLGGSGRLDETGAADQTAIAGTRVMTDGRISLKYIGDVEVVGLTLTELADYLKKLYSSIFEDPIVTTTMAQSNSLRYTMMGNVNSPGIFMLDYPMTIVQVVARSGGFSEWADKEIIVVRKNVEKQDAGLFEENTLNFDYDDFISGKDVNNNIIIRSGDIIVVN